MQNRTINGESSPRSVKSRTLSFLLAPTLVAAALLSRGGSSAEVYGQELSSATTRGMSTSSEPITALSLEDEQRYQASIKLRGYVIDHVKGSPNRQEAITLLEMLGQADLPDRGLSLVQDNTTNQIRVLNKNYATVGADAFNDYQSRLKFTIDTKTGQIAKIDTPAKNLPELESIFSVYSGNSKESYLASLGQPPVPLSTEGRDMARSLMVRVFGESVKSDAISFDRYNIASYTHQDSSGKSYIYTLSTQGISTIEPSR